MVSMTVLVSTGWGGKVFWLLASLWYSWEGFSSISGVMILWESSKASLPTLAKKWLNSSIVLLSVLLPLLVFFVLGTIYLKPGSHICEYGLATFQRFPPTAKITHRQKVRGEQLRMMAMDVVGRRSYGAPAAPARFFGNDCGTKAMVQRLPAIDWDWQRRGGRDYHANACDPPSVLGDCPATVCDSETMVPRWLAIIVVASQHDALRTMRTIKRANLPASLLSSAKPSE